MAFLDDYTESVRVELGHGYWIDIKPVLTYAEQRAAEKHLRATRTVVDENGKATTTVIPNLDAYRFTRLMAAITDWNLDEKDGSIWSLDPKHKAENVNRLPASVVKKVDEQIDALSKEDTAERVDFRDEAVGSDSDGDTWAAPPVEVPAGEVVVGEPWDSSGATS